MNPKKPIVCTLYVLVSVVAASPHLASVIAAGDATDDLAVNHTQETVRMLDGIYKTAVV